MINLLIPVSSIYLTAIPGNLAGGTIGELIGPKRLLMNLIPLVIICWGCLSLATSIIFLFIPRLCLGFLYGLVNTLVQPLVTEMCEPKIRGIANFLPAIIVSASVLCTYLQAHFLPWRIGTAICGAIFVPILAALFFVPEVSFI